MPFRTHRLLLLLGLAIISGCTRGREAPASRSSDDIRVHNRAVALMGQFDYGPAQELFKSLVDQNPGWEDAKVDLAISILNRQQPGDDEEAAAILDDLIQQRTPNLRARYCRAILYLNGSEPEAALSLFDGVAGADPTDAYAQYFSGQCHFQLGHYAKALEYFVRAQTTDPYLRSAYYGAFQAAQQLDDVDAAKVYFDSFQRLDNNPQARLAEIKYTRMGPKAEVRPIVSSRSTLPPPKGPLFTEAVPLAIESDARLEWRAFDTDSPQPSITCCDINHDGMQDLFVCGAVRRSPDPSRHDNAPIDQADGEAPDLADDRGQPNDRYSNVVLMATGTAYRIEKNHPLADIDRVNAAVWGDIDNDGRTDVYLCRDGPNQLWKQRTDGTWSDITEASLTSGGDTNTVDGACFDADHDGDLDLFLVNRGPNELLSNNLDGTFRRLASAQGIAGQGDSRGIVVGDFDSDRDVDILVVNQQPPHEVYRNDRLWKYERSDQYDPIRAANIWSAVSADTDADGSAELLTTGPDGITHWSWSDDDSWNAVTLAPDGVEVARGPLAVQDINGDGRAELVVTTDIGWAVLALDGTPLESENSAREWTLATSGVTGYRIVSPISDSAPVLFGVGSGRFPFAALRFSGKENNAEQMRTNASGIGVQAAVRVGSEWSVVDSFRIQSGRGQSLQPIAVGMRDQRRIDFVSVDWPDGVLQTEVDLAAGPHLITETQRQVSSCPVVFAWDGQAFRFVTDVLGVGGIGFNHARGEYHPPRPWENLLLPEGLLKPLDGEFVIKLGEPMDEIMYLDAARLVAYDMPAEWDMVLDERLATGPPQPTGDPHFYRVEHTPVRALDQDARDVTRSIREVDGEAVNPGVMDRRFLGRTAPFHLTLEFGVALDQIEAPVLVFDGWVEYPYSQTMFSAWQAGASYDPPTLEARGEDGEWQTVYRQFGYMAGMPRRSALPLDSTRLPVGTTALRIRSNLELYLDSVSVIESEECPQLEVRYLEATAAVASEVGFPKRRNGPQKRPHYDYGRRAPLWDTKHLSGAYTEFGDVFSFVSQVDDASAIIGPGEEIEFRFRAPQNGHGNGAHRRFVLEANGWCKDRDLFTQFGESVDPVPTRAGVQEKNTMVPAKSGLTRLK